MADRADGSIVINTKLDTTGIGKGSKEMQSAISSLTQQVNSLGKRIDNAFTGMQKSMNGSARSAQAYSKAVSQTGKKADSIEKRFAKIQKSMQDVSAASAKVKVGDPKSLADYNDKVKAVRAEVDQLAHDIALAGQQKVKTEAFKDLEEMITKCSDRLQNMIDRQEKMALHGQKGSKAYKNLSLDIQQASEELEGLRDERFDMLNDHTNDPDMSAYIIPGQTQQFLDYEAQLAEFRNGLADVRQDLADTFGKTYTFDAVPQPAAAQIADPATVNSAVVDSQISDIVKSLDSLENLSNEVTSSAANAAMMTGAEATAAMEEALGSLAEFDTQAEDARTQIEQCREALEEFGSTKFKSQAFADLEVQAQEAMARLSELQGHDAEMEQAGLVGTEAYSSLQGQIANCVAQVISLNNEMNGMKAAGTDMFTGADTDAFKGYSQSLNEFEAQLGGMQGIVDNAVSPSGQAMTRWQEMTTVSGMVKNALLSAVSSAQHFGSAITTAAQHPIQTLDRLAGSAMIAGTRLASMAGHTAINGLKSIGRTAADAAKSVLGLGRSVKSSNGALQGGLWNIIKYGLGVRSVFALVNRLRSAIKEGFSNLAGFSGPVKSAIDSVTSSLSQLKNSLAAAMAPIFTAVAPAIVYLCNLLSTALSYIAQFMAAITGGKSYTKATKGAKGLAGAMGDAGSAAKETERQLAQFDKLDVLSDKNSGGGGGGGGGGAGAGGMFEEVPIESAIADFVARIKEAFAAGDFEEVGRIIAEAVNGAVLKIRDFIAWENVHEFWEYWIDAFCRIANSIVKNINWYLIGETIAEGFNTILHILELLLTGIDWGAIGRAFGTALNGLVDYFDWALFGRVLGERIQAGLDFLYNAITTFQWSNLGKGIANGVNSLIDAINWKELGQTFSSGVRGLLQAAATLISEIDWWEVGEAVAEALSGIDWGGILHDAFMGMGAVAGGISALIGGFLSGAVQGAKEYFQSAIEESGGDIVLGILKGILDAIAGIGKWIVDNIFTPFIEGFKSAFGISSPAKEMQPLGEYIFGGVLKGILSGVKGISKWFKTNVVKPIKKAFEKLFDGDDLTAEKLLEISVSLVKKGWSTLSKFVGTAVSVAVSLAKKGWTAISGFIGSAVTISVSLLKKGWTTIAKFVGTAVTTAVSLSKKGWTTIASYVGTAVTTAVSLSKKGWTTIAKYVGTAVTAAVSLSKKGWSTIASYVGTAVSVAISLWKKSWSSISNFVGTAVSVAISLWKNGWSSISSFVGSAVSVGVSLWRKGWSTLSGWIGSAVSVGVSLFKSGWSSIKSWFGLSGGGIIGANGGVKLFSAGGVISRTKATWWDSVQKYASGTAKAHGTAFVAGESGPEIVGHVNGRTEVLNKSQIATAIHGAVLTAMADAANAFARFIGGKLTECANGIISAVYLASDISFPIPVTMQIDSLGGKYAAMLSGLGAAAGITYTPPAVSTGTVMPYSVAALAVSLDGIADAIETSNDELGQIVVAAIGNATMAVVTAIQQSEARGNTVDLSGITQRTIDDINRRTRMYSASPIV